MEKKEIEQALADIHYLKEVISKDREYFQKFLLSKGVRYLSLFFAIGITVISLWAYFYIKANKVAPANMLFRWIFAIGLIFLFIIAGSIKWLSWNSLFPEIKWPNMLFRIVGVSTIKVLVLLLLLMIGFSIGVSVAGEFQYLLLIWALGAGIAYCIYGSFFHIPILEITGYFITITGGTSLLFICDKPVEGWLWTAIVFGGGFILFYLLATISLVLYKEK